MIISTKRLCKAFGEREVIHDCSLSVEQGSIYGLLGINGAGKTTVLKLLLGLLRPSAGTAAIMGMDSVKEHLEILRYTGSLIETPVFYEHLSASDNLKLHLAYMGMEDRNVESVLYKIGLTGCGTQPVSTFSLGMRQRLAIARAMIHKPKVLILDEPVNGLDPVGMKEMRLLFRSLADEEGVTILMSTHMLSEVEQVADRIGILADGRIVLEESTEEIMTAHPEGMEKYFLRFMEGRNHYE